MKKTGRTPIHPWHETQWAQAQNAFEMARFPHAILLSGMAGMGKHDFTNQLVRGLLCFHQDRIDSACASCKSCRLLEAGNHPDLIWIEAEQTGNSIKVRQIRELADLVVHSSFASNQKIVVINFAENMNAAAANALLKLLEEPPTACVFLLITEREASLPATITSRCQRWLFNPLNRATYQNLIGDYDPLRFGAPLRRESSLLNESGVCDVVIKSIYEVMTEQNSLVRVSEQLTKYDFEPLLRLLILILHDLITLKTLGKPGYFQANQDLRHWAQKARTLDLFYSLDRLNTMMRLFINKVALNRQLYLDCFLIGLKNAYEN